MRKLWTKRKGVSTMIGGIIILTLFLSALSVMVFISQQYDTYQSTVEAMNRKDTDAFSENLVPVYPGLYYNSNKTETQGACSTGLPYCHVYSLYVSNGAAIGTQITRIYVNSTDSRPYIPRTQGQGVGCGNLCAFDASVTPQPFHFLASSAFVNPSEYKHEVIFYTNDTYTLPNVQGSYGLNSIAVITARGRMFSFQWPIPPNGVATVSYLSTDVMQIAYQGSGNPGFGSSNEPAAIGQGSGGSSSGGFYCHSEQNVTKVATGSSYGTLWFVNPWVTSTIFNDAFPSSGTNHTSFYVSVLVTNNQQGSITITRGNIWLQLVVLAPGVQPGLARVLVLGGTMVGTYYNGVFTPAGSSTTVDGTYSVILIYKVNLWSWAGTAVANPSSVVFSGMVTMTNDQEGSGVNNGYFSGTSTIDGLYVRPSC